MFAPTDVCGIIKDCEINNNAKCQGGWAVEGASPYRVSGKFAVPQNRSALCGFYVVLWDGKSGAEFCAPTPLCFNHYFIFLLYFFCTAW